MKIKAVFFDIDGTLLNSKSTMTEATYKALKVCEGKGLLICLATARAGRIVFRKTDIPWDFKFLLKRGIFYNGGTIFDKAANFYQHTPIPDFIVTEIARYVSEYNDSLQIALQHDDEYHSFKYEMADADLINWGFRRNELLDYKIAQHKPATKIMIFGGNDFRKIVAEMTDLFNKMSNCLKESVNIILADSKKCIYILSKHVNKGNAIQQIISLNGIKPNEVAVFGDDTPDIGMFGMFGHSIAMGNAHEVIKQKATFVTLSNDEDGVVYALKEHLELI
jgi:Cof subfamily protein (haloacid dehalogenase superfamily)